MNSLEIREFQQAIINFANSSQLPMEAKRLAVEGILRQLETAADAEIRTELKARQAAAAKLSEANTLSSASAAATAAQTATEQATEESVNKEDTNGN